MKKSVAVLLVVSFLLGVLCCAPLSAHAEEEKYVEQFPDGSRIETTSIIGREPADPDDPNPGVDEEYHGESGKNEVTRTLTRVYYDAGNHADWKAVLTATFRVGRLRAICVDYAAKHKIYDSAWRCNGVNMKETGNPCTAVYSFSCTVGGITVKTVETTLQLACDRKGNVTESAPKDVLDLNALQKWLSALRLYLQRIFRFL